MPAPVLVKPASSGLVTWPAKVRFAAVFVTSIVRDALPLTSVKPRSVVAVPPVYWKVPPSITRLEASAVEAPMLLVTPPLEIVFARNMPSVRVVEPV